MAGREQRSLATSMADTRGRFWRVLDVFLFHRWLATGHWRPATIYDELHAHTMHRPARHEGGSFAWR